MGTPPTVRIFFSSPGDVKMERETARRIVERLQAEVGDRAVLEPYFWEHAVLLATKDYQQNIPSMEGFDVVVCMLWSRLGSPLDPERHPRPDGGNFESGTEYEFFMAMQAHRSKGAPDVLVFRNRTEPRRPSRPKEAREAVDREVDRLDQFFERYFRAGDYFTGAVNSYRTLGEFEEKLTLGLRGFLEQQLPPAGPRRRAPAAYGGRPYLGLAAFDFADAPVFFGRTAQVGEVIVAFQTQEMEARATGDEGRRFVLVLGSSGSGKSSLARAGVLPMLVQPGVIEGAESWRRAIFKPGAAGGDPFLALAVALLAPEALPELGSDGSTAAVLAGLLRRQPAGAGLLLRQALSQAGAQARFAEDRRLSEELRRLEGDQREEDARELRDRLTHLAVVPMRLALLCDQLEELFTAEQASEVSSSFIECLAALAESGRVFVLATLRSDFYPRCLEHPKLVELMRESGSYALPAPGPSELGQMIRQPAAAAGLLFEANPTTGETLDELLRDAALRDPAALPLLSYTLEQLHERRTEDGVLTLAAYRELGGLEGAIGRRAETVFSALPGEAQAAFDGLWRQLVTLGEGGAPVRRRALRSGLGAEPGAAALVDALVAARLLIADQAPDGESSISVAHEALLRHWPRVVKWVEGNRDFLRARARLAGRFAEWLEQGRTEDYLLPPGPALGEAESILARHGAALDAAETDYVRRSAARARAREQARLRRSRLVAAGAVVLSILALIGGAFAWRERGVAHGERATALLQKDAAEKSARAAHASQTRAAYLLGIEMLESGKTREGLTSLAQALTLDPAHAGARDRLYSYHLYGLPKAICLRSVAAPSGTRQRISGSDLGPVQRCVYLDGRGAPEVFDLTSRQVVPGPWTAEHDVLAPLLNRTSSHLLCIRSDDTCRVWSLDDGAAGPVITPDLGWSRVNFSDDGRWLVEGGSDGRVRLWSLADGSVAHEWFQSGSIESIELDARSELLATAGDELVFFDVKNGRELARLDDEDWRSVGVRLAKESAVCVVEQRPRLAGEAVARFIFVESGTGAPWPGARTVVSSSEVFDFALNRDGSELAIAPFSDVAYIRNRDDPDLDRTFEHDTYPALVRFSPDARQLVTATSNGTVRIWDAQSGELAFEAIGSDGRLEDLDVSWDGRYLLTSTGQRARLWDLSVGRALTLPLAQEGSVFAVRFEHGGDVLWTASESSGLQAWDERSLEARGPALLEGRDVDGILIDDRATRAAVLLADGSIAMVDLGAGRVASDPWTETQGVDAWAMSADGSLLAFASDGAVRFLDTASGRPTGEPWTISLTLGSLRVNADGSFAVAIEGGVPVLHEVHRGASTELATAETEVFDLRFSPDGRWLAGAGKGTGLAVEHDALLWDLAAPPLPPRKLLHGDKVLALGFSPDSRWLATGTKDQIAQVWNVESGRVESDPMFHPANVVREVVFSPDGRLLATHCGDQTLRVYDWREARAVSQTFATDADLVDLVFAPDATRLAAIAPDPRDASKGYARVWEVSPPQATPFDIVALTEAATALRVSTTGLPVACDPFEGWERLKLAAPDLWFFQSPARRAISPAFEASSLRWIKDVSIGIDQTAVAMPAVGMVRAAMSYWKQLNLNAGEKELMELDPESEQAVEAASKLAELERSVAALVESAARGANDDASTCLWLSLQAEAASRMEDARIHIDRALALAPDDREILVQASDVYLGVKDFAAEFDVLTRLSAFDPDSVERRSRLGFNRWRCGERARAEEEFSAILDRPEVLPGDRAYMLVLLGRAPEALAAWIDEAERERATGADNTIDTIALLIAGYQLTGDSDAAVDWYRRFIAREAAAADAELIRNLGLLPDINEALSAALAVTLERHPELRPN